MSSKPIAVPPGLSSKELDELKNCFQKHQDLNEVILFGSRAMGNHKSGSDIDLLLKGSLSPDTLFHIREELAEESFMPYFFDFLTEKDLENLALKKHIEEEGLCIYRRDEQKALLTEDSL